jgi:hypothetical protein
MYITERKKGNKHVHNLVCYTTAGIIIHYNFIFIVNFGRYVKMSREKPERAEVVLIHSRRWTASHLSMLLLFVCSSTRQKD